MTSVGNTTAEGTEEPEEPEDRFKNSVLSVLSVLSVVKSGDFYRLGGIDLTQQITRE